MFSIAILLALAGQYLLPLIGWSTKGLQEERAPSTFRWNDSDNEWLYVSSDSSGARWYLQLSSDLTVTMQELSSRKVWLKVDHTAVNGEQMQATKMLWSLNCISRAFSVDPTTSSGSSGMTDGTNNVPSAAVIPPSIAAKLAKRVCRTTPW